MPLLMLTEVLPCSDWDEVEVAASSVGTIEGASMMTVRVDVAVRPDWSVVVFATPLLFAG
jgi:hypothetical protein